MSDIRVASLVSSDTQRDQPARRQSAPPFTPKPPARPATPVTTSATACHPKARLRESQRDPADSGASAKRARHVKPQGGHPPSAFSAPSTWNNGIDPLIEERESDGGFSGIVNPGWNPPRNGPFGDASGTDNGAPFSSDANQSFADALSDGTLDPQHLANDLLPMTSDNGIFEVDLPGGETMGVVVNVQPAQVSFLLSPSSAKLGEQLRPQQMELARHLERRIHRNVKITVL